MRISEATIRSIVRRKLLEAVTVGREGGAEVDQNLTISIPLKSTREEVKDFLDKLDDGSKIYVDNTLLLTKKGSSFVNDTRDDSGATDHAINANLFVRDIFGGKHSLEEYEVYNSKNEKVSVDGVTVNTKKSTDAASGVNAVGSVINPERAELLKWQKEVSARPLQLGSKGPSVGILQDLLDNALNRIADDMSIRLSPDRVSAVRAQFNPLVKPGKDGSRPSSPNRGPRISIASDAKYDTVNDIAGALAFSLSKDNDFGPVTRVSVYIFQQINNLQPDGKVGKDTAAALMKYANPS
jgi:peptidoglycan hydrolase-like protein with peptidoglycan-binding domain